MFKRNRIYWITSLVAASIAGPLSADVLEEVIVTSQKTDESVQNIPVSVSAFTGAQMQALGIKETTQLVQQVPGLQVNAWSPAVTIFNLRGISQNNFQDNLEAPVAVYFDDAYMGSLNGISGQLFDVARTEVLRGPQGTLFGRNATGGLIHYISQGADSDKFNGYIDAGAGSFDRRSIEAAVGGGLADKVRGRVAARWEQADGYIKAVVPGVRDIGGADGYALRGNLQIDLTEKLLGDFWLKYSKDNNVPTGGYAFENCPQSNPPNCDVDKFGRSLTLPGTAAGDAHKHLSGMSGHLDRDTTIGQAKFSYEISKDMELVSISNFTHLNKDYLEDGDGLPDTIVILSTNTDYTQGSQEFRLSGDSGSVHWQTGAYYLNMRISELNQITGAPALNSILIKDRAPGADLSGLTDGSPANSFDNAKTIHNWTLYSQNWSVFGQTDFQLTDDLKLTTGARWSQDKKNMKFTLLYRDDFNPIPILVDSDTGYEAQKPGSTKIDYGDWAGRVSLDYHINYDLLVFASANRGIKGGNFTASIGDNINVNDFKHKPETLYSYETGFKANLLDNTMRLNGTVFYYNYLDYQAFSLAGGAPLVKNTGASVYGGELELVWMPGQHWDFNFGLSYLKSKVNEITGPGIFGVPTEPIRNAQLPNSPKFKFNYLARYNWDVGVGNVSAQIDGVWNDRQFLEVTNGPGTVQKAYNITNTRLTYTGAEEKYTVSLFAENVFNQTYKAYTLDLGNLGVTSYYAPPVTYGADIKYKF